MENLIIFLLSLFIDLNEFDKYRLNSYFSESNQNYSQYIYDKNLYYTSFHYKIKNKKNYIQKITVPINSFKEIKEIRFSTYKFIKTHLILDNLNVICNLQTCDFTFDEIKIKNLNIDVISDLAFKNDFILYFKEKTYSNNKQNVKLNNLEDRNDNNLLNLRRFNLNDFISEIKLQNNFDFSYLALIKQKIKNYENNNVEVDKFLADYINSKRFKTAYITYKDGKYFLISKIYTIKTKAQIVPTNFFINEFNQKNSNLSFNLSSKFHLTKSLYLNHPNLNMNITKIAFYITLFILTLKILFVKLTKNLFLTYKSYFIFYFLFLDSFIFNLFSIIFIFYFFLLNKKHLKHV